MNSDLLIDAIVRQTTVLLGQLATATGKRASLAHIANQIFLDLVAELKTQGMTNPVIADMFGLALRSYHKKLQRLGESSTFRGLSLWSAVHHYIVENGATSRSDVLLRFSRDDEVTLRGVLADMVEGGVLYASGSGDEKLYRTLDPGDAHNRKADGERLSHLVWVAIYRFGPLDLNELRAHISATDVTLEATVSALVADGRVREVPGENRRYSCAQCYIPVGSEEGWEAAVFDHYQAVVTTICRKLALRDAGGSHVNLGGSTYRFTVWKGHPEYERVKHLLRDLRAQIVDLRTAVEAHNALHGAPTDVDCEHYLAYAGQACLDELDLGEP
jgi:hypothetical protein